jgi:hypothetical protein
MSRIRSVHPGLWTDERFMEVSPLARLLQIGIWNECDDKGSFEWSPIKLKARLLPVDNCDINELLDELVRAGSVIAYEIQGRKLGAVRNFTRYQRPKKPNSLYPQTDEVRNWCSGERSEVPNQFPTDGENAPQMEDGGGRREEVEEKKEGGAAAAEKTTDYAFSGRTIRLNQADFDNWRSRFHAIPDMAAELTSLDAWLGKQPDEKRKSWFHQVPGMLNRKHQEMITAAKAEQRAGGEMELPIA